MGSVCRLLAFILAMYSITYASLFKTSGIDLKITEEGSIREGYAQLNQDWHSNDKVHFNLFNDFSFSGKINKKQVLSENSNLYQGNIDDDPRGYFIIAEAKGVMTIRVLRKDQLITINHDSMNKRYKVLLTLNNLKSVDCKGDHLVSPAKLNRSKAEQAAIVDPSDNKTILSVGVIATESGLNERYGGTGETQLLEFETHMQTQVAEINRAFDNSEISLKYVFAGYRVTTYVDQDHNTDLGVLTDGTNEDVKTKRDELHNTEGADLIGILGKTGGGLAWVGLNNPYMSAGVKSGWGTLGHEWGHNLGCQHDKATDGVTNPTSYNLGWLFTGNDGILYNTIMAYNQNGSRSYKGFSNPNVQHQGVATGDANEADNARLIMEKMGNGEKYNKKPSINLTSPVDASSYAATSNVILSCTAVDLDSTIEKVEYFLGNDLIGSSTSEPYTVSWDVPIIGTHTLFARATDKQGATNDSETITIFITGTVEAAILSSNIILEEGETKNYEMTLNGIPNSTVTVTISSSQTNEFTVTPNTLNFSNLNWDSKQRISITAIDDSLDDGDKTIPINYSWSGGALNGSDSRDVTIIDNDESTLKVEVVDNLSSEDGDVATLLVSLNAQPTATVTITPSTARTEGITEQVLTFTESDWNVQQSIEIRGVDDAYIDGDAQYQITLTASSNDSNYNGASHSASLINKDNEEAKIDFTLNQNPLKVEEGGVADNFSISIPSPIKVPVYLVLHADSEITLSTNTIELNENNYNKNESITVTAVNDEITEFGKNVNITVEVRSDSNPGFLNLNLAPVPVRVEDFPAPTDTIIDNTITTVTTELGKGSEELSEQDILNVINEIYSISNGELSTEERGTILTYLDTNLSNSNLGDLDEPTSVTVLSTIDGLFPTGTNTTRDQHTGEEVEKTTSIMTTVNNKSPQSTDLGNKSLDILSRILEEQREIKNSGTSASEKLSSEQLKSVDRVILSLAEKNLKQFSLVDAQNGLSHELKSDYGHIFQKALDPSSMGDSVDVQSDKSAITVSIPSTALGEPSVVSVTSSPMNIYSDIDNKDMVSMLVHIDIYSIASGKKLDISKLEDPIAIKFDVDMNKYITSPTSIRYFDASSNSWSNSGLFDLNVNLTKTSITVNTTHLTPYAVVSDQPNEHLIFQRRGDELNASGGCLLRKR